MRCTTWIVLKFIKQSRTTYIVIGCLCLVMSIVIANVHTGEAFSKFLYESIEWGIFCTGSYFFINVKQIKTSEN